MTNLFLPSRIFCDIYQITPDFLLSQGIRALILDIDNTLVTYDDPEPTEPVLAWLSAMREAGIAVSFVSNNHAPRVERFCRGLDLYYHADAGKPSTRWLKEAMAAMGSTPDNTAAVGDQLFTDVWGASRAGCPAYLVPPIRDKKTPFFRFKRLLEKPFLRAYYKKHPDERK